VTVLEKDQVASGASGGLGMRGVRANGRDPRELSLARRAHELWPTLADRIGADTGFEQVGHLLLYEDELGRLDGGLPSLPARKHAQEAAGIPSERIDGDDLAALEPGVSDAVDSALYSPNDGIADHTATTRGLAQAAADRGATIREDTTVTGLERADDRVTAVETADGDRVLVEEDVVVLNNYGAKPLLETAFDLTLPIWKTYPQVIATEPMDEVPVNHLIGHDHRRLAIKALPDQRVMISGGWAGREDDAGTRAGVPLDAHVEQNVADARDVFPGLEGVGVSEADAGHPETVSVDGVPIIDSVPGVDNVTFGTGWCGHGFAISIAATELLARWLQSGTRPTALEPFALARFGV
jgi:sarcosine oxidase subunit beta